MATSGPAFRFIDLFAGIGGLRIDPHCRVYPPWQPCDTPARRAAWRRCKEGRNSYG